MAQTDHTQNGNSLRLSPAKPLDVACAAIYCEPDESRAMKTQTIVVHRD